MSDTPESPEDPQAAPDTPVKELAEEPTQAERDVGSHAQPSPSAPPPPPQTPDAAREIRNAFSSLKSAAGALFGSVQPALKDALDEADKVFQTAKQTAKPAVSSATEEAERMVRQIGQTAEPLAKSLGGELHRFTGVLADAVEGAVKGAQGAVSAARTTGSAPADGVTEQDQDQDDPSAATVDGERARAVAEDEESDPTEPTAEKDDE